MTARMNHFYSNEWCKGEHARTQEELQNIAKQIRQNCKAEKIDDNTWGVCTIYTNESLGLKYWVKDQFGHISEIDEARYY